MSALEAGSGRDRGEGPVPRVSVILPTLNAAGHLPRLLPALRAQVLPADWNGFELCAVDSSSEDDTRALLVEFGALVRTIERSDFGHGRTRNLAAGDARGEFLVFLSQDALPEGRDFLRALVEPLADDPRTAGTWARVLPHADDDPLTRRTVLDLAEAASEGFARELEPGARLAALGAAEREALVRFNNVASAIRASIWRELPLPDVPFGEDFGWAARALEAGHRLRFVPEAVARHAHRYGPLEAFRRYRTDAAFHRVVHGRRVRPTLASALRGLGFEWRRDLAFLFGPAAFDSTGPAWLGAFLGSPFLRAAQVAGQYAGSRGLGGPTEADFEAFRRIS